MKNYKPAQRIRTLHRELSYQRIGYEEGCGCSFDCDEHGNVLNEESKNPAALENLRKCRAGDGYEPGVIREYYTYYTEPATGTCVCGVTIDLGGFTNTCDCGRDYNSFGQLLAPRSQWGEETGEHLGDILRIR